MRYQNKSMRKLILGEILRDSKPNLRRYKYLDKWIVGIIVKLKYNPILVFFWSFWNKIGMKECIIFHNEYGKQLNRLTETFANKFICNVTIEGFD